MRAILITGILLSLSGCGNNSRSFSPTANTSPTPDQANQVALNEIIFQVSDPATRAEARKTAAEFVRATLPGWTIKGLSSQVYAGNEYRIAVNVEKEKRNVVVSVIVRRFFRNPASPIGRLLPNGEHSNSNYMIRVMKRSLSDFRMRSLRNEHRTALHLGLGLRCPIRNGSLPAVAIGT
jgi:hypothetical protein